MDRHAGGREASPTYHACRCVQCDPPPWRRQRTRQQSDIASHPLGWAREPRGGLSLGRHVPNCTPPCCPGRRPPWRRCSWKRSSTWWTGTGVAAGPCTAAKPSLVSWLRVPRASACARCWALVPWPRWTRPRPHCPLGCGGVPRALLMVSGCSGGADEEAPVAGGCSSPPAWCPASWKASAASNAGSFP